MLGSDVYGNITRINNALEAIKDKIPDERLRIEDIEKQLENAKIELQKPFILSPKSYLSTFILFFYLGITSLTACCK